MILVDTSVWVSHLRQGDAHLTVLLNEGAVTTHPFVAGSGQASRAALSMSPY